MKRIFTLLMIAALVSGSALTFYACTPREEVLRIATWEAYTDEQYVKTEFPKFFMNAAGKKIKVKINTFESNEELYDKLTKKKVDYDVICPSDYMVQRLIKEERLIALDKTIVKDYDTRLEADVLDLTASYDSGHKWTLPYAWGTFGIMYNTKKVEAADMVSWNALWNKKPDGSAANYDKKIWIKDSERDVFALANIYNNRDALKTASINYTDYATTEYQDLIKSMYSKCDTATLDAAKAALIEQKKVIYKYEAEEGKESLAEGKDEASLGFFWSCDAGYAMQKNPDLRYSIPVEGANVYVDCFVIPQTAGNPVAAQHFMNFLLDKDAAYANTMASGASGTVAAANIIIKAELEAMTDGFMAGVSSEFRRNYIDTVVFPNSNQKNLQRCSSMQHYEGTGNADVTIMFASVKTA